MIVTGTNTSVQMMFDCIHVIVWCHVVVLHLFFFVVVVVHVIAAPLVYFSRICMCCVFSVVGVVVVGSGVEGSGSGGGRGRGRGRGSRGGGSRGGGSRGGGEMLVSVVVQRLHFGL